MFATNLKYYKSEFIIAFADMLHDSERNKMYYEGLKAAIALKRSQGQPVHVLDIGKLIFLFKISPLDGRCMKVS